MLKMMGWSEGQGLGRHGDGITAPIPALGKVGRGGLGYEDEYLVEPPEMPSGPVPADVERGPAVIIAISPTHSPPPRKSVEPSGSGMRTTPS